MSGVVVREYRRFDRYEGIRLAYRPVFIAVVNVRPVICPSLPKCGPVNVAVGCPADGRQHSCYATCPSCGNAFWVKVGPLQPPPTPVSPGGWWKRLWARMCCHDYDFLSWSVPVDDSSDSPPTAAHVR